MARQLDVVCAWPPPGLTGDGRPVPPFEFRLLGNNLATHRHFAIDALKLDAAPANDAVGTKPEVPEFKWIHGANVGEYNGHHQGSFCFTAEVFASFVKNFRSDPRYRAGAEGKPGVAPVLPCDFEHASEMPPWEGTIPASGAPAPGWVYDVTTRKSADGVDQLWLYCKLGPRIREYIAGDEYRSVSIAFTLEARDWKTDQPLGPALTSMAFTNQPFMRDLTPLAASQRQTSATQGTGMDFEKLYNALRLTLCQRLGISHTLDDNGIAGAVDEAKSKGSGLDSVLEALGVPNAKEAMKLLPSLAEAREKLTAALAELDDLMAADAAVDQGMAALDVANAMSAKGLKETDELSKRTLGAFRRELVAEEIRTLTKGGVKATAGMLRKATAAGRERFLTEYGIKERATQHLGGAPILAGPGGQQLVPQVRSTPEQLDQNTNGAEIDISVYPGANKTMQLHAYCAEKAPGFMKLSWAEKCRHVAQFRRTHRIAGFESDVIAA